ncbi:MULTISPECIES: tellurite resistance TerB family protein [unclassified Colwellia]|uniref:tellurite resistance TerB family protein n=1 Tax=unclassified Colwellia TaxID=196834 RepID=UPI0015F75EBA|nr:MULTISPECIES: TerB family tellurite resistance protein [unclassified Colwellia]MBA6232078.1 TerB family tellurite resistance protein [Colwellia sp. MB02u-7]MBA6237224.1 TerB family tellurite resistance protein [Colwellia sp. MB02u-11]MBA6254688.1 TerB family tellurite resistance protein [Colwellia sp. MB3u-28]MBA6260416.1 TerB family tellurite resistance protein [Colwellia sp. MB3u-41]MBA6300209.1 TerB family tellurite resistance protein [Colwellia sp. MB3u-22]
MLTKISSFFQNLANDLADNATKDNANEVTIELACAVLLCEVMRADGHFDQHEQAKLAILLVEQFNLNEEEVKQVIDEALMQSEQATDFYRYTSKINQHFSIEQRITMVEHLWKMAYADGELVSIEEHVIRKIGDLLQLRHAEYIQTKPRK